MSYEPCEPCGRELSGMNPRLIYGSAWGHKHCISEGLFDSGLLEKTTAGKFCICFSQGHPDKLVIEKLAPHTKEYEEAAKIVKDIEKKREESIQKWKTRIEERE